MDTVSEVEKLNAAEQLYHDNHSIFKGQHVVQWGRPMLPMPRTGTQCMTLPLHHLPWMWWIWTPCHGLSSQNTPFRHTEISTTDLAVGTTGKTKKEESGPDHSLDMANIIAPAVMICTEAAPNHSNGTDTTTIEAAQDVPIQHTKDTATGPAVTHHTGHTANPLHTAAHWVTTLRIIVDHVHDYPINHQSIVYTKKDHTVQDHAPTRETESPT